MNFVNPICSCMYCRAQHYVRGLVAVLGGAVLVSLVAFLITYAPGCATVKLAEKQCGAAGELRQAGAYVAQQEAAALACAATTGQELYQCEEAAGAVVAARAVANSPAEVTDVLKCAAALVADLATGQHAGDAGGQ